MNAQTKALGREISAKFCALVPLTNSYDITYKEWKSRVDEVDALVAEYQKLLDKPHKRA